MPEPFSQLCLADIMACRLHVQDSLPSGRRCRAALGIVWWAPSNVEGLSRFPAPFEFENHDTNVLSNPYIASAYAGLIADCITDLGTYGVTCPRLSSFKFAVIQGPVLRYCYFLELYPLRY